MKKYRVWKYNNLVTIVIAENRYQACKKILNLFSRKEMLHVKVQAV